MLERPNDAADAPQTDGEIAPRPVKFRGAGFTPRAGRYSGWIALVLVIGLWQLAGSAALVNPLFLPAPSAIAVAIYKLALSGALWHHLSYSIMRIGTGWLLGTVAGVILITLLQSILSVMQMPEFGRHVTYGVVIIAMLLIYGRGRRHSD